MEKQELVYVTFIRTTPEKLWDAITKPEFTRQYWGGAGTFPIGKRGRNGPTNAKARRILSPGGRSFGKHAAHRLVLTWADPDAPADKSRVSFEIEAGDDMTKLTVIHGDLPCRFGHGHQSFLGLAARALELEILSRDGKGPQPVWPLREGAGYQLVGRRTDARKADAPGAKAMEKDRIKPELTESGQPGLSHSTVRRGTEIRHLLKLSEVEMGQVVAVASWSAVPMRYRDRFQIDNSVGCRRSGEGPFLLRNASPGDVMELIISR